MRKWMWRLVVAVVLIGGAAYLAFRLAGRSSWPTWLLTDGAVLAILAAVAFAGQHAAGQAKREWAAAQAMDRRVIATVAELVEQASAMRIRVVGLAQEASSQTQWRVVPVAAEDLLMQFRAIPTLAVPDRDLVRCIASLRQMLLTIQHQVDDFAVPQSSPAHTQWIAQFAATSGAVISEARQRCRTLLAEASDQLPN